MGLDQYMYAASKAHTGYSDTSRIDLGYRRKHPNLHGWMQRLHVAKKEKLGKNVFPGDEVVFNGVELELTWDDLKQLEEDIKSGNMANLNTTGFFFGNASDDYYREQDLKFISDARYNIFMGFKVFYNSSW